MDDETVQSAKLLHTLVMQYIQGVSKRYPRTVDGYVQSESCALMPILKIELVSWSENKSLSHIKLHFKRTERKKDHLGHAFFSFTLEKYSREAGRNRNKSTYQYLTHV